MGKRIFYFDALRALAIICVVVIHVAAQVRVLMPADMNHVFTGGVLLEAFCNNSFRIGVDLFLVLSGALSLGREWKIRDFLSKRIPRIAKPFVFWVLFNSIILIGFSYFFTQIHYTSSFDFISILKFIMDSYLGKAPSSVQNWFFWMIIGTYLIMPIFNKWLLHADLKEVEYFLVIWLFVSLVENTLGMKSPIKLTYFTSPIGLVVLGYYLRHTKRSFLNNKYIGILLIICSSVLMLALSYTFFTGTFFKTFNRYSILNIIEVIGIVCLFKTSGIFETPRAPLKKVAGALAKTSYGIYLVQCPIINISSSFLPKAELGITKSFIILFTLGVVVSYLLVTLASKIPFLEEYSGSK